MRLQRDLMKVGVCWYEELDGSSPKSATVSLSLISLASMTSATTSLHPRLLFFNRNSFFPLRTFLCLGVLDNSAMFTSNGVAKNSGKRKMMEFAAETAEPTAAAGHQINLFNLHGQQHFASPSVPLDAHGSHVQQILNNASPFKPFAFMSLLTADDNEDDSSPLSKDIKNQSEEINQMILLHSENLRQVLKGVLGKHHRTLHQAAEEKAAKKLKERELELQGKLAQNAELQRMVEHYKAEAERMLIRVRHLERAKMSLRERLQEANAARRYAETAQEEAESSFEDPDRVGPIRLDCKVCGRQLATVMMWPCRHVCVCTQCEAATKYCPVCHLVKTTSVEVYLPLN